MNYTTDGYVLTCDIHKYFYTINREICYKMVEGLSDYLDYLKAKNIPFTIASASIKENMDFFVCSEIQHVINQTLF